MAQVETPRGAVARQYDFAHSLRLCREYPAPNPFRRGLSAQTYENPRARPNKVDEYRFFLYFCMSE